MSLAGQTTRRGFLRKTTAAAVGAFAAQYVIPSTAFGANERIVVGCIGVGRQGNSNLKHHLDHTAAVCDVDAKHLAAAVKRVGGKCDGYRDFRRLLDRKDIDAVVVSTPDHWHAIPTIQACQAGKHVYCEKPLSLFIREGRAMVNAARDNNVVVQTGTQQRSSDHFGLAIDLFRGGAVGKPEKILVNIPGVNWQPPPVPDSTPPAELDYDFWLGPAPKRPYNEKHVHYMFRFYWDYSGGQMTNFGAHHLDMAQKALGADDSGPISVQGTAEFHPKGWYEVPMKCRLVYEYPGGVQVIVGQQQKDISGAVTLIGSGVVIRVDRRSLTSEPKEIVENALRESGVKVTISPASRDHHLNWLECIATGERPHADVEIGHRSSTACHLGNIALRTGSMVRWDPATEQIIDNPEAAAMLSRPYRAPWKLG